MTTIHRPCMQDLLSISVEFGRPHSGYWLSTVARRFGLNYDIQTCDEYLLRGTSLADGNQELFGRLVGLGPGLVVMDPARRDLVSHRGLLSRAGSFFTTMMFFPESGRNISIMPGLVPTLPRAVAYLKCSGEGQSIRLGLSLEQWKNLTGWLDVWLPE